MKVVFILNEYSLHNHIVETYISSRPLDSVSIVKVPLVLKGKNRIGSAKKILPKLSKRFILYKFQEFLVVLFFTLIPKMTYKGAIFRRLRWICLRYNAPYFKSEDVHSESTLDFLKSKDPDLVITLFHQILKPTFISIPKLGVINIHPGILPDFRGVQPYFWELLSEKKLAGPTFHFIEDESVDTGRILASATYYIWQGMSVHLNYYLTTICAAQILPKLVTLLDEGGLVGKTQDKNLGSYYSWPDSLSISTLFQRGHSIFKLQDIFRILLGQFDDFKPDQSIFFKN